jgi:Ca-activated chloride channel family protein
MHALHRLIFASALMLLAAGPARAQSGDDESATLWLDHAGRTSQSLALVTDIEIEVTGLLGHTLVRQQFLNDSPDWAEGRYVFPLPDGAAVESLRVVVGDRLIEGEIQERGEARRTYEAARAEGRAASLVEQERANWFSTRIANIAPGEVIEVQIGFRQKVAFEHGEFRLRFPMSIAPPYRPAGSAISDAESTGAEAVPPMVGPLQSTNPIALRVELSAGMPLAMLESSHHPVDKVMEQGRWIVTLDGSFADPHRDFELVWRPAVREHAESAVFVQRLGDRDHALLMLTPPEQFSALQTRREVTLIIDTSGSMQGQSIEQARQALLFALDRLARHDRFNLIEFSSGARALFAEPVDATGAHLRRARDFVRGLGADGGTEMLRPLDMALNRAPVPGYLPQVVFVTDGQVGNTRQIIDQVRQQIGRSRLFTVGIGHGVNTRFLSDLARFGRGSSVLIGDLWQVRQRMSELVAQLTSPVLHDIELHWPAEVEALPARIPDLYTGQPLLVTARGGRLAGDVLVTGSSDGQPWQQVIPLETFQRSPGVAAHWGRQAIQRELDRRGQDLVDGEVRQRVVDLSIEYQLLSPYTSLVAVDKTPRRSRQAALRRHDVPSYLADDSGEADAMLVRAMPATDAGSVPALIRGLLALLLVALLLAHRRLAADSAPVRGGAGALDHGERP